MTDPLLDIVSSIKSLQRSIEEEMAATRKELGAAVLQLRRCADALETVTASASALQFSVEDDRIARNISLPR